MLAQEANERVGNGEGHCSVISQRPFPFSVSTKLYRQLCRLLYREKGQVNGKTTPNELRCHDTAPLILGLKEFVLN